MEPEFTNLRDVVDYVSMEDKNFVIVAMPPHTNDPTDEEDSDRSSVLDIPVSMDVFTDDEYVDENKHIWAPPSSKSKTTPASADSGGSSVADNMDALRRSLKGKTPLECFEEIFTEEVFEMIVRETQRYAETVKNKQDFSVTGDDVKILVGILLLSGYRGLPRERDYWSDSEDMAVPLVKAAMDRSAYVELKSCLHFQDSARAGDGPKDRAYKIRPLIDLWNKNCQKWGVFHEALSAGEMVVPYHEHKVQKYARKRSIRIGYKLGILCGDGYCYKTMLYCGYQDEGRRDSTEGLRSLSRQASIVNSHFELDLKTGGRVRQVADRNARLVDRYQGLVEQYSIPIRGNKWYWYIFTRIVDMAVVNAHHIFNEANDSHKCLLEFRREIAVPYLELGRHGGEVSRGLSTHPPTSRVSEAVRFDGLNHTMGRRDKQGRCQFKDCSDRAPTYCVKCNVTLCTSCFPQYHIR